GNRAAPDPPPSLKEALMPRTANRTQSYRVWRFAPSGFTLIELLVAVAIIALLIAILLPNLSHARRRARTTVCAANLHALGIGLAAYLDANDGLFPRYYTNSSAADPLGPGRLWWFGFEPNGPGSAANRPLDKTLSPLAAYTANLDARLQCPDFPY